MTTRALIVDDHPIIRSTLVSSLLAQSMLDEIETASTFHDLREKLDSDANYQLLILDLSLTDISGAEGVASVREHYPDIPVLVFSASDSPDIIAECFEYGVHGFVSKTASMQIFVHAIRVVLSGNMYIPPDAARMLGFDAPEAGDAMPELADLQVRFTPRQKMVFEQLLLGVPNKIIARRLDMAEGTVKTHLHGIYQQLRVNSRAQAILKSRQINIV